MTDKFHYIKIMDYNDKEHKRLKYKQLAESKYLQHIFLKKLKETVSRI